MTVLIIGDADIEEKVVRQLESEKLRRAERDIMSGMLNGTSFFTRKKKDPKRARDTTLRLNADEAATETYLEKE